MATIKAEIKTTVMIEYAVAPGGRFRSIHSRALVAAAA